MVKKIIKYPAPLSVEYATDVRIFNDELFSLIDNLKDTINENNLEALSAFQIGSFYNVIVVKKDDGSFLELINPRLIAHSGKVTTQETTAYYQDMSAEIQRYEHISIVYQDRDAKDNSLQAQGKLAIILQRKIDYTFGATFIHKMSKEEKEKFEAKLSGKANQGHSNYTPVAYKKDKIMHIVDFLLFVIVALMIYSFFLHEAQEMGNIWNYELYITYTIIGLLIASFVFTYYESKIHKTCTTGQMSNVLLTSSVVFIKLVILLGLSYYFITPS
ncbi:peptide deformylase [Sulfurimonas sp.]